MLPYDKEMYARMLEGRTVIVATTASISIYRIPDLIRDLRREGAEVIVGMSESSEELVGPETMRWASEHDVVTKITGNVEHINLFINDKDKKALLIAPASYDTIGKMASGVTDTIPPLFFSFAFGYGVKTIVAPAMHRSMMENPINKENVEKLRRLGVDIVDPIYDEEKAKLSGNQCIIDHVCRAFYNKYDGKSILIISGRGEERIDPVRSITNDSTGYTGYWIARVAYRMGFSHITYIGNSIVDLPTYVNYRAAYTVDEFERLSEEEASNNYDYIVVNAALPDFKVIEKSEKKYSSNESHKLTLEPREKLVDKLSNISKGKIVAFRLTENIGEDPFKHFSKRIDMAVVNSYKTGPFGKTENEYRFVSKKFDVDLGRMPKPILAKNLVERLGDL
ncbi:DNA/pantothenate metabolism flavoprotein [Thermoplasma volcanium GSS1]|uniref:DNA/pantothenate metabolism flavoprotein n=1 Tax=Thermoplasma volcanium (strain ATCC 51530 / DSM 4299 / JCM 9571 / NBRC 15438 / GSS1) TaxID=273116 RepID=Q97A07_THEVO|nr:bifunctional phosphopantothenoylcysteine decarboxylase/phosphopantothenate--cysteine ligase CoaBC [Thermoplasma volcanium]BAB60145.1 DNA/pantothenate metabolism flavoprotein [Thermoplasma volcanium GSS1]